MVLGPQLFSPDQCQKMEASHLALSAHLGQTKRAVLLKAPREGGLGKEQQVQMPREDHEVAVGRDGQPVRGYPQRKQVPG